jgi:hypothetical protein
MTSGIVIRHINYLIDTAKFHKREFLGYCLTRETLSFSLVEFVILLCAVSNILQYIEKCYLILLFFKHMGKTYDHKIIDRVCECYICKMNQI